MSFGLTLANGAVGFMSAFVFVQTIFGSLKEE
jgi:hypothetical protein